MFEWLHPHHDSLELEHAKHRQEERDAGAHADPLEEIEYIDEDGLIVEEIDPETCPQDIQRLVERRRKKRIPK
ncbi:MAG: hypothetical protein A2Z44_04010 [Betaproteobacteria bacterium RBG_19FT_COMBO_58_11]|nr:MAG: hypothetical protein A2Z44_04010 [Betaproteobacteria bacterium RBG_19FT_COMBO_58_11]